MDDHGSKPYPGAGGNAYLRADLDPDFLGSDDVRGLRLALDYRKPELHLRSQGVEETVVVFGGTRIRDPETAQQRVEELERRCEAEPGDAALQSSLAVARRLAAKSCYYEVAREFGRLVGRAGTGPADSRLVLMTGGGPGIMEAANRGAADVGAKSIGLNITLPEEQFPNPYISPELCFSVRYFAIRKLHFLLRARALVVFPGGYGTLDELFETLNLALCGKIGHLPVVLVGEAYWRGFCRPEFLVEEGVIGAEDLALFWYAETAADAWNGILEWHRRHGAPLVCDRGD